MKKTILITWWTGYIGSHAVVAFEQAGYKTVIVDNLVNSSTDTLGWIKKILGGTPDFFEVDLRNKDALRCIFQKYEFDGVLHFAGLKSPGESQQKALYYFENNISGSISLFEVMEEFWVKKIVFSSSANTYSTQNIPPIKETDSQDTTNPYGTTKLLIEKILSDLVKFTWFQVVNLRYFNPIGAHSSGYLWELPNGIPNNLFPFIFKVLVWELPELSVLGNDYDTPDGTGIRDYIDVVDLVWAHVDAYRFLESGEKQEVFNVGTGKWVSVLEAIENVERVVWKKVKYTISPRRPGDIPISFCDTTKIQNILWWKAQVSLQESIANMWRFYNNNQ